MSPYDMITLKPAPKNQQADREAAWEWAILLLAMTLPTFLTWTEFVALADRNQGVNSTQQAAIVAGKTIQFSLPVLAFWLLQRRWPRPAFPNRDGWAIGVVFGLVIVAGMLTLYFGWLRNVSQLAYTPAIVRSSGRSCRSLDSTRSAASSSSPSP
jgi:hypothetical protein